MASISRHFVTQLPAYNQTEQLKRFFSTTVDPLFQPGKSETLSGYIGEKPSYYDPVNDFYIPEPTTSRTAYQLEPAMVSRDSNNNLTNLLFYEDIVNQLRYQGALTEDPNRLFEGDYYSWAPPVDLDKLLNFKKYYWNPSGPPLLEINVPREKTIQIVSGNTIFDLPEAIIDSVIDIKVKVNGVDRFDFTQINATQIQLSIAPNIDDIILTWINGDFSQNIIGQETYQFGTEPVFTSGMRIIIVDNNTAGGWDLDPWDENGITPWDSNPNIAGIKIVEGVGTSIILVDFNSLNKFENPQYVIMERGASDQNPWTEINNWYHADCWTIFGLEPIGIQAQRPILEFFRNIRLYDYGFNRRPLVNVILDTPNFDINSLNGQPWGSLTINDHILQDNDRILAISLSDQLINNRVYKINNVGNFSVITLQEDTPFTNGMAQFGDVLLNLDDELEYWFNGNIWKNTQRRIDEQQAPLFNLYDNEQVILNDPGFYNGSNFSGSKLFGFEIGDNTVSPNDSVLGFPLVYNAAEQIIFQNFQAIDIITYASGTIEGFKYFEINNEFFNGWYLSLLPTHQDILISPDIFEIPLNLQANPNNEQITEISRNQFFDHFAEIISKQEGITGSAYNGNNWRDTKKDLSLGTKIIQNRDSMLRLMLFASQTNIDMLGAIRYVEKEYNRFKNKFLQKFAENLQNGTLDPSAPASTWTTTILTQLSANKTSDFAFYNNGMGGGNYFIPPTPAYLGIMPLYNPIIFLDSSLPNAMNIIRNHDGSFTPAYNDWRDNVLLDFEQRCYFNSPSVFQGEVRPNFDIVKNKGAKYRRTIKDSEVWTPNNLYNVGIVVSFENFVYRCKIQHMSSSTFDENNWTQLYNTDYSWTEVTRLEQQFFDRWSTVSQLDYTINEGYSPSDPFTWNFSTCVDRDGESVPGNWRGIYNYYFDTDRPHSQPWEMLGFTSKPTYWDITYGPAPYTRGNSLLWKHIRDGYIAGGPRIGIDLLWARPNILDILPVDDYGNLLDPVACGIIHPGPNINQAQEAWKFGDGSPIETTWRRTEFYSFDESQVAYLMKPTRFCEENWDPKNTQLVNNDQWIYSITGYRLNNDVTVQGENDFIASGYQQWISSYLANAGITTFGSLIRGLNVQLAHKMAGYTDPNQITLVADNFGVLPNENFDVSLYKSPSIREEIYSGVIIQKTVNGWTVVGYDIVNPQFNVIYGDVNGPKQKVTISETAQPVVNTWRPNTYYNVGIFVIYQGNTYRSNTANTSASVFETQYWTPVVIPPVNPLETVVRYTKPTDEITSIAYGTEFKTHQEVANFLFGYGTYLISRGWLFDTIDSDGTIRDWKLAVKEFLFWLQIQWAPGNFVAISPYSNGGKYQSSHGLIQDLEQQPNGLSGVLSKTGLPVNYADLTVSRLDDIMTVVSSDNDIYAIRFSIVELEHVLLIDNITKFNDIVYQPLFNLRQPRLRFIGFRTQDWKGNLNAPGFVIGPTTLMTSFDKIAEDIRTMFNIENVDNVKLRDYARHNVGYQSRPYLTNLLLTETNQFEFYLGMIQSKGTSSVFERLLRSKFIADGVGTLKFFEEWGFRVFDFGNTDDVNNIEFYLKQSETRKDPQIIQFITNTQPTFSDVISLIDTYDTDGNLVSIDPKWVLRPSNIDTSFPSRATYDSVLGDFPTAGWVRIEEVPYSCVSLSNLPDVYTEAASDNNYLTIGDRIWVYEVDQSWDIYRVCVAAVTSVGVISKNQLLKSTPNISGTDLTFSIPHGLKIGDNIIIDGSSGTLPDLEGFQIVTAIYDTDPFKVLIETQVSEEFDFTNSEQNTSDIVPPNVYVLRSIKGETVFTPQPADHWKIGDLFYQSTSPWKVIRFDGTNWQDYRSQPYKLDTKKTIKGLLYNNKTLIEDQLMEAQPALSDPIQVYDPIGGLIPGVAKREITYFSENDPARYNNDFANNMEPSDAWSIDFVGKIWWNLSTVKFLETELDVITPTTYEKEIRYRSTHWGKIASGTSVDMYEWTRSTIPPESWADAVANATGNDVQIYSGTILNTTDYTTTQEYDSSTGVQQTIYYFWVNNKQYVPANNPTRKISAASISQIITSPTAQNIPWLSPITTNALIASGIVYDLNDTYSVLQLNQKTDDYDGVHHRQWELMRPGDVRSLPSDSLWSKMKQSLVGFDNQGNAVPDPNIPEAIRLGNWLRPRQTWFSDKFEARRNFVDSCNLIFSAVNLLDERPNVPSILSKSSNISQLLTWIQSSDSSYVEPFPRGNGNTPFDPVDDWNIVITDPTELDSLALTLNFGDRVLVDGTQWDTPQWIVWKFTAQGYKVANLWDYHTIDMFNRNVLVPTLNTGDRVLVDGDTSTGGFWTIWIYLPTDPRADNFGFVLARTEDYRTEDYFQYVDWYADGYSPTDPPAVSYDTISERNLSQAKSPSFVKVNNDGSGKWIWTFYTSDNIWITVAKQENTIAFTNAIYNQNFTTIIDGINNPSLTNLTNVLERDPSKDLNVIIDTLRDEGTVLTDLEINTLFFDMISYVHAEQDLVDWCFKTSFLTIGGYNETLNQSPVASTDHFDDLRAYIEEVKPYHVKIRDFSRILSPPIDTSNWLVTDFDKPVYYDTNLGNYRVLNPNSVTDQNIMANNQPWKSWYDNYLLNPNPIRKIKITIKFDRNSCYCDDALKFGWDSRPWDTEGWDNEGFTPEWIAENECVYRILKYYQPTPDMREKDVCALVSNCQFQGTIIDGGNLSGIAFDVETLNFDNLGNLIIENNLLLAGKKSICNSGWDIDGWDTEGWDTGGTIFDIPNVMYDNIGQIQVYTRSRRSIPFERNQSYTIIDNQIHLNSALPYLGEAIVLIIAPTVLDLVLDGGVLSTGIQYIANIGQTTFDLPEIVTDLSTLRVFQGSVEFFEGMNNNEWSITPDGKQIIFNQSVLSGTVVTFLIASVEEPSDINVDGSGLRDPIYGKNQPEELVTLKITDPISLNVYQTFAPGSPNAVISNIQCDGVTNTFGIGQKYVFKQDAIWIYWNGVRTLDFTVNWFSNEITLGFIPKKKDTISIQSWTIAGTDYISEIRYYVGDAITDTFTVDSILIPGSNVIAYFGGNSYTTTIVSDHEVTLGVIPGLNEKISLVVWAPKLYETDTYTDPLFLGNMYATARDFLDTKGNFVLHPKVLVNGIYINNWSVVNKNTITITPQPNALDIINVELYSIADNVQPIDAYLQQEIATGSGQIISLNNPSNSLNLSSENTFVYTDGLLLTGPECYYLSQRNDQQIIQLTGTPINVSDVTVLVTDENLPAIVGIIPSWTTISDIDLNSIPPSVPVNANFVLVENVLVMIDVSGFPGYYPNPNYETILKIQSNTGDWHMQDQSTLIIDTALIPGQNIWIQTFTNSPSMISKTSTYINPSSKIIQIPELPWNPDSMQVFLNGKEQIYIKDWSFDFGKKEISEIDFTLWKKTIKVNKAKPTDVIVVITWAGVPNRAAIAWKEFMDYEGNKIQTRIADRHKGNIVNDLIQGDQSITIKVNPKYPGMMMQGVKPFDMPQTKGNVPGVVWIDDIERIEYWKLVVDPLDSSLITISNMNRGSKSTNYGIIRQETNQHIIPDGVQTKFYLDNSFISLNNLFVLVGTFENVSGVNYYTGEKLLAETIDYTIGVDGGGMFVQFIIAPETIPTNMFDYGTDISFTLRFNQVISDWTNSTNQFIAGTQVINAGFQDNMSNIDGLNPSPEVEGWDSHPWDTIGWDHHYKNNARIGGLQYNNDLNTQLLLNEIGTKNG